MEGSEARNLIRAIEKISGHLNRTSVVLEEVSGFLRWAVNIAIWGTVAILVMSVVLKVQWGAIAAGTHCVVMQDDLYGIADLKTKDELDSSDLNNWWNKGRTEMTTKDELDSALKTKDDIGVHDLISSGKVYPLSKETKFLVLDSTDFLDFTYYRKIRLLSGEYYGKAVWIPNSSVNASSIDSTPQSTSKDGSPKDEDHNDQSSGKPVTSKKDDTKPHIKIDWEAIKKAEPKQK